VLLSLVIPRIILIALSITISGCLYVPWFGSKPHADDALAQVLTGETTRAEVLEIFGEPDVSREQGKLWIYENGKITGALIAVPIPVPGAGAVGTAAFLKQFEDLQSLLVEFENDTVKHFRILEEEYGCYSNDICLISGWALRAYPPYLIPKMASITSIGSDDQLAKRFNGIPGRCSIYIYSIGRFWKEYPGLISLESIELAPLNLEGYLHVGLQPGKMKISVFASGLNYVGGDIARYLDDIDVMCTGGSVFFVEVDYRMGRPGKYKTSANTRIVSSDLGKEAILGRNLLILP
jgi:hypothetical protein